VIGKGMGMKNQWRSQVQIDVFANRGVVFSSLRGRVFFMLERGKKMNGEMYRGLSGRSYIEPGDFTMEEMNVLFELGESIQKNPTWYSDVAKGFIMGTLFLSPVHEHALASKRLCLDWEGKWWDFPNKVPARWQKEKAWQTQ